MSCKSLTILRALLENAIWLYSNFVIKSNEGSDTPKRYILYFPYCGIHMEIDIQFSFSVFLPSTLPPPPLILVPVLLFFFQAAGRLLCTITFFWISHIFFLCLFQSLYLINGRLFFFCWLVFVFLLTLLHVYSVFSGDGRVCVELCLNRTGRCWLVMAIWGP